MGGRYSPQNPYPSLALDFRRCQIGSRKRYCGPTVVFIEGANCAKNQRCLLFFSSWIFVASTLYMVSNFYPSVATSTVDPSGFKFPCSPVGFLCLIFHPPVRSAEKRIELHAGPKTPHYLPVDHDERSDDPFLPPHLCPLFPISTPTWKVVRSLRVRISRHHRFSIAAFSRSFGQASRIRRKSSPMPLTLLISQEQPSELLRHS
jgi:hypothetical protein